MELFFSREIDGSICRLDADESAHCVKVLRHREGDDIHVIDGEGTLYTCRILSASPKAFADIPEEIRTAVDYVVEPSLERGSTGLASQIIKLEVDGEVTIIRP